LNEHPGGKKILLKVAGQDASKQFDQFHSKSVLEKYGPSLFKGDLGGAKPAAAAVAQKQEEEKPLEGLEEGDMFGDGIPFGDPYWYSDWASPYYDESHRRVRAVVRNWVEKHAMPYCHEWDEKKELPRSIFLEAAKAGILQAIVGHADPKYFEVPLPGGIEPSKFSNFHEFIGMFPRLVLFSFSL
jgi:hypothetical protein